MKPETIRALTPIFLATIGGAIGIAVLVTPGLGDAKWSAGLGLAGTAIAGAAGLAQSTKSESVSVRENGHSIPAQGNSSDREPIVEVKSFLGPSRVRDFEAGLGQYILYRLYLAQLFPEAVLYMAVNDTIYRSFFLKSAIQFAVTQLDIKLIVFDVEQEVIVQWIG